MRRYYPFFVTLTLLFGISAVFFPMFKPPRGNPASASAAAAVVSPYKYNFYVQDTLYESGSMNQTTSPYWWVNSGAKLILFDGKGETIQGTLPITDPWRIAYATANPRDTDNGAHPQNIFRLVSRSTWNNVRLEASYYIAADNFSPSANRNASNGLLLMSRYSMDGQTLYYAGLRVDGTAILKKKINGAYYTMAQKKIFPGTYSISAANGTSRNLLPHNVWLRLRSDTVTNSDGSVTVKLSMQSPLGSGWQSLLTATDRGEFGGTAPITGARYTGIRTDFMDVKFDDFLAQNL